jgi:hypothetical protein
LAHWLYDFLIGDAQYAFSKIGGGASALPQILLIYVVKECVVFSTVSMFGTERIYNG